MEVALPVTPRDGSELGWKLDVNVCQRSVTMASVALLVGSMARAPSDLIQLEVSLEIGRWVVPAVLLPAQ